MGWDWRVLARVVVLGSVWLCRFRALWSQAGLCYQSAHFVTRHTAFTDPESFPVEIHAISKTTLRLFLYRTFIVLQR